MSPDDGCLVGFEAFHMVHFTCNYTDDADAAGDAKGVTIVADAVQALALDKGPVGCIALHTGDGCGAGSVSTPEVCGGCISKLICQSSVIMARS